MNKRANYQRYDLIRFTKPEYADSFLDGQIYMNSIGYFREKGFEDQKDILEAAKYYEDSRTSAFISGFPEDFKSIISGNVVWLDEGSKYCNVACFYKLKRYKTQVEMLNPEIRSFGDAAIHIFDVHLFLERIIQAARKQYDFYWCAGDVDYYNPFDKDIQKYLFDCFCKTQEHAYQKEWRLAVLNQYTRLEQLASADINAKYTEPYTLNVGSIRDIARIIPTDELLKNQAKFFPKCSMVNHVEPVKKLTPEEADRLFHEGVTFRREELDGAFWGSSKKDPRRDFSEKISSLAKGNARPMFTIS